MKTFYYEKSFQMLIFAYILLSILYTLNLHTALIINYPQNGFWFLTPFKHASVTLMTAYIFLSAFFLFLWTNRKLIGGYALLFVSSLFIVGIFTLNLPFLTKKPISLSSFAPTSIKQGFSSLQKDMSVASSGKSETWTRLSTQYFFYPEGLGTHANSEIIYPIAGRFSRFTTDMGVDTESGNQASVQFEIWGDTNQLFQSSVMGRYTNPIHADVDITGVQNLILKVDSGANNFDDHADWLEPKLWP